MTFQALLAFSDAVLCGGLAVVVFWRAPQAFVHRTFAAGMGTLAWKNVCTGIGAQAALPLQVMHWERLRMVAAALLPGIWLLFSLSFARSNYQDHLKRWRWCLLLPGYRNRR